MTTAGEHLAALLQDQARACERNGSRMYAELLDRMALDSREGGPVSAALAGFAEATVDDAVPLRLMGALHRLVLERAVPELALHYPSVGGRFSGAAAVWPAVLQAMDEHAEQISASLQRFPQTNEVGRAAALAGGLRHIGAVAGPRVRLLEIGASAGLNLQVDSFAMPGNWGPAGSTVVLPDAWQGAVPPTGEVQIVDRAGVDLDPVDVSTVEGRLLLTSYVWADQVARFERLRAALHLAGDRPVRVSRGDALAYVRCLELEEGVTTVLWHSVFWQYVPVPAQQELQTVIDRLSAASTKGAGFAHLRLEPAADRMGSVREFEVRLRIGDGADRVLGTAPPHGLPVTWAR